MGKIFEETTQEKQKDGSWVIGVDIRNSELLIRIGKLVEKKEMVSLQRYHNNRIHYKSKEKLLD